MVRIKLIRFGKKFAPTYRIVAIDSRRANDSRYIEKIGHYNPKNKELVINKELALKWLRYGAQPSLTVKNLFSSKGIVSEFLKEKEKKHAKKNIRRINNKKNENAKIGKKRKLLLEKKTRLRNMRKKTRTFLEKNKQKDVDNNKTNTKDIDKENNLSANQNNEKK